MELHGFLQGLDPPLQVHLIADLRLVLGQRRRARLGLGSGANAPLSARVQAQTKLMWGRRGQVTVKTQHGRRLDVTAPPNGSVTQLWLLVLVTGPQKQQHRGSTWIMLEAPAPPEDGPRGGRWRCAVGGALAATSVIKSLWPPKSCLSSSVASII